MNDRKTLDDVRILPAITLFRRWGGYARKHWKLIAAAYCLILIVMAVELAIPKAVGFVLDRMLTTTTIANRAIALPVFGEVSLDLAFLIVFSVLSALILAKTLCVYNRNLFLALVGERLHIDLRSKLFRHLQRLPISYFDMSYTGRTMARLTTDTDALWQLIYGGSLSVVAPAISIAAILVLLFQMNVILALLAAAVTPLIAMQFAAAHKRAKSATRAQRETLADIYTRLQEQISGMRIVRLFGTAEQENSLYLGDLRRLYEKNVEMVKTFALLAARSEVTTSLATMLILCLGGAIVARGRSTVGELVQFYLYAGMLFTPIRQLTNSSAQVLSNSQVALQRVFDLLDQPEAEEWSGGTTPCMSLNGKIVAKNVSFAYDKGTTVLRDISFEIEKGMRVALVGHSGVGKTSLVNLLCRFYSNYEGTITINGTEIREYEVESYRKQISYVLQDPFLFKGTVAENIRYANPAATDAELEQAAQRANAHEFIVALADGYNTELGERGARLSGGQKQRLSIARSLLRHPGLLIFDEPTSSLDAESESILMRSLDSVFKGITTIVIAHRLSTVVNADMILVLGQGTVIQQGTHSELMAKDGLYRDLCRRQFLVTELNQIPQNSGEPG